MNDLFGDAQLASDFIGGTVYQGFIKPASYHRWHSPIDGKINKVFHIPGTFFPAPGALSVTNWNATIPARVLVFIESEDPEIGTVCFILVGMSEA